MSQELSSENAEQIQAKILSRMRLKVKTNAKQSN